MQYPIISRKYLKDGEITLTDWMTRLDDALCRINDKLVFMMNDILNSRGYLEDGEMTLTDWRTWLDGVELRLNNNNLVCIMNNAVSYYYSFRMIFYPYL